MRNLSKISIEQHIYNGKLSDGKVTDNRVDIILNQESKILDIKARRGFIGTDNQSVSVEFKLDSNIVGEVNVLSEVINDLQATGQDMVHDDNGASFDGPGFISTISIFLSGIEYYVPLENEIAKKAISASGITVLSKMSNKEIVDKINTLV